MATATELTTTVGRLEERLDNHIKFFWTAVAGGFGWLLAITLLLIHVNGNISTLGIGASASQLSSATSPAKAQRTLEAIAEKAILIRLRGKTPRENDLKQFNAAYKDVGSALSKYSDFPETWKAASALVNLREANFDTAEMPPELAALEGPPVPNLGDCYYRPMSYSPKRSLPSSPGELRDVLAFHDCTLVLDDSEGFQNSPQVKYFRETAAPNSVSILLTLVRVKVIYRGGPIVPAYQLTMYNCTFDFEVPVRPPPQGQLLLATLLAIDITKGNITVPLGQPV